jgi:ATP-dependent protease ClpP protease subunit
MSEGTIAINERTGLLKLHGAITEELSLNLREKLDLLVDYYQHRRVTLQINSDGGQVTALRHILDGINAHRVNGVQFATAASFKACSAAAMLLASGEPGLRVVSRQTSLLFHLSRQSIPENHMLTADAALRVAAVLSRVDAVFEQEIATHLRRSYGGFNALAQEGIARCKLLQEDVELIRHQLGGGHVARQPMDINTVCDMWNSCSVTNSAAPYLDYLRHWFARDDWMGLTDAYALLLIDAVEFVPAMLPEASRRPRSDLGCRS